MSSSFVKMTIGRCLIVLTDEIDFKLGDWLWDRRAKKWIEVVMVGTGNVFRGADDRPIDWDEISCREYTVEAVADLVKRFDSEAAEHRARAEQHLEMEEQAKSDAQKLLELLEDLKVIGKVADASH